MTQNYSDSEDSNIEFTGFNSEDIANENDFYVPDSEPDSDISVSTLHSSDISNLGEEKWNSMLHMTQIGHMLPHKIREYFLTL